MLNAILGKKVEQSQRFLEDGTRIPVTIIATGGNFVAQIKTAEKDGYSAVQLAFGKKKRINKPLSGHVKKAGLPAGEAGIQKAPRFFRETRIAEDKEKLTELPREGDVVHASAVFKPGDIVLVTGISKGKGFSGVVKRHHFKGGPRTHGQSDRERAPGSIGQTTTPGRVYKGKRMAGRMGNKKVTVKNLQVMDVSDDQLLIRGLVPGGRNSLLLINKTGEAKKFVPLYREEGNQNVKEERN